MSPEDREKIFSEFKEVVLNRFQSLDPQSNAEDYAQGCLEFLEIAKKYSIQEESNEG